MNSEPLAYLRGRFLLQGEARLTLHDVGFVQGVTVTDLCRTFGHRLFRLADHLRRFRQSCDLAGVPQPVADAELERLAGQLVAHNAGLLQPDQDLALVLFATPGPVGYYLGEPGGFGDGPPTLGLHTFPLPFARYASYVRAGAHLVILPARNFPAVDPRIKHRSRLHWWLAQRAANDIDPAAVALLLDGAGHVTETAAANLLVVREGQVLTPPRGTVLAGVSLAVVEELCGELGIGFAEQALGPADCYAADEVLLAGTSFCLVGVSRIDGRAIPWPGKLCQKLLSAWSDRVGVDICRQILANP